MAQYTEVRELEVFQAVVKHLSYAGAANETNLSPSGVSRLISRLEKRLGATLLERTTRKLTLTEAGKAFLARTQHLLDDLERAEDSVRQATAAPTGLLRLSTPVPFGQTYLAPLIRPLLERCPEMSVELILRDAMIDMVGEGIDLVVRIGRLRDSRLVARRLCANRRVLVAAPEYLARRGVPGTPKDLADHKCLTVTYLTRPGEWKLVGPDGEESVSIGGWLSSNNIEVPISAAEQGLGIAVGPTQSVAAALSEGRLVRVLPGYELEPTAVYAMYPSRRQLSSKVRATVDFLSEQFSDPPPWDVGLQGVPGFERDSFPSSPP